MMEEPYKLAERQLYSLLKKDATRMRKNLTEAESILWTILRKKQLGVKFHRQYIIETYIVDFVCLEKQLIIEVDGKYHFTEEQQRWDEERTNILNKYGFTIVRFLNEEVLLSTDEVINKIKSKLNTL